MKSLLIIKLFLTILFVFSFSAFGQTPQKIEQDLVAAISEVEKYSSYGENSDIEKLEKANDLFEKSLLKYTKTAATLKYNFPTLGDSVIIATSADGKFRTYSWDTESGGTMHDFSVVYQYQGADGKVYSRTEKTKSEDDFGSFIYSIFSVNGKSGKIYAVCTTFIGSTSDHFGAVRLFKIKGNELIDKVKLLKTTKGLTDSISFEYNFFSVVNRPERPLKLITFDEKTNTIKIPVVVKKDENDFGTVTDKFINYRFNGTYFVKVK